MTISQHSTLILPVLQSCTLERLQKAVCGLADGSLTITLTRQTETDIRALVKNGDAEYGVTLTEGNAFCSCRDAMYRGGICKHAAALALYALRTPTPQPEVDTPTEGASVPVDVAPTVESPLPHLCWSDGLTVCGSFPSNRVHRYPWNPVMLERACRECLHVYRSGYNNSHMIHVMTHKAA